MACSLLAIMSTGEAPAAGTVHWVVQENQSDATDLRAIVQAVETDGHKSHLVPLWKGAEIPTIGGLPDDVPVVCHGPAFVPRGLSSTRLRPGIFFDPEIFCWSAFQSGWRDAMLSSDGRVVPLCEARAILRERGLSFVRPDADSKIFEGGLYDLARLRSLTEGTRVTDATSVVVASPIIIDAEWRFFIVNREIVACSEYRRWGRLSTHGSIPHAAIELAAELASRWSPADVYCLDLALNGSRLGIVEANCFNASRFYSASVQRIVRAVNAHVLGSGRRIG